MTFSLLSSQELSTTLYASSISELKDHIANNVNDWDGGTLADHVGGTRIILTAGKHVPDPADLPINPKRRVTIEGQGEGATTVDMSGIAKPFIERDNSGNQIDGAAYRRIAVKDIEISGDQTAGSVGIRLSAIPYVRLERVHANYLDQGIVIEDGSYFADVVNCDARNNLNDGLTIQEGADGNPPNGTKIHNGEYAHNGGDGIYLHNTSGVTVDAYAELNDGYGIHASGCNGLNIMGSLELNGAGLTNPADVALSPDTATDTSVDGASISASFNTDSTCIWVGNANGVEIKGCRFRSSTAGTMGVYVDSAAMDVERTANSYVGQIDVGTSSLPTDELIDSQDGGAWETLRELGYESGDYVPLGDGSPIDNQFVDFADTTNAFQKQSTGGFFVPPNTKANLRLRFIATLSNDTAGETTYALPHPLSPKPIYGKISRFYCNSQTEDSFPRFRFEELCSDGSTGS
jgi:hypothetical protein